MMMSPMHRSIRSLERNQKTGCQYVLIASYVYYVALAAIISLVTQQLQGTQLTFFVLCVFVTFEVHSILGIKICKERSVGKIYCHNELPISRINVKSSGPQVYQVSKIDQDSRLGSFILIGSIREHAVAISRCRNRANIKIKIEPNVHQGNLLQDDRIFTRNVVFKEVFSLHA